MKKLLYGQVVYQHNGPNSILSSLAAVRGAELITVR